MISQGNRTNPWRKNKKAGFGVKVVLDSWEQFLFCVMLKHKTVMIIKFSNLYAKIASICFIVLIVFLYSLTHMAVIKRFYKTEH